MAHDPCSECAQDNRLTVCAECMQDAETEREKSEQALDKAVLCSGCETDAEVGAMFCAECTTPEMDEMREALSDLLALFDDTPDAAWSDLGAAQMIDYLGVLGRAREILVDA